MISDAYPSETAFGGATEGEGLTMHEPRSVLVESSNDAH